MVKPRITLLPTHSMTHFASLTSKKLQSLSSRYQWQTMSPALFRLREGEMELTQWLKDELLSLLQLLEDLCLGLVLETFQGRMSLQSGMKQRSGSFVALAMTPLPTHWNHHNPRRYWSNVIALSPQQRSLLRSLELQRKRFPNQSLAFLNLQL